MCMGHMDTPLVWQSMIYLCCVCTGGMQTSSKHVGGSKHMGVSKHTGGIQTYGVSKHIGRHMGASKHTGPIQTYGGIQTYKGHPNIQGALKHMGASKCMGAYGHPLSVTKHAFFVLCMYRGHPNIWGTPMFGCPLNMCGHSHIFWMFPYVWKMVGCPLYIHSTKSMLCQTKGVSICPIHVDAPCTSTT